jgi:pimeloyl-ACP methyl ester carboxylesterase
VGVIAGRLPIEPFTQRTPLAEVEDLRARLRVTRWPDRFQGAGWSLGTDADYLNDLVSYWAEGFDWFAQESALNRFPRYRATIGGVRIHFVHARASGQVGNPLPLILTHGWPDSFWRYLKVIGLLTNPVAHGGNSQDAFDVVVPDLPGFGYSECPSGRLVSAVEVADLWAELMSSLGYERFGAVGGDIGSNVSRCLGINHRDRIAAVHRMDAGLPSFTGNRDELEPEERAWIEAREAWGASEGAYMAMHRTKPQTAAFALNDSPAGLAGWIVEKLRAWSDCDGEIERRFSKDEILTNVTIYWLTGTIGSSMRMYRANSQIPPAQLAKRVEVPSGFSFFPAEVGRHHPPRRWLDRVANVVRVTEPPRGGHFAPFEEPELYAEELRDFFRPYRAARAV